MFYGFTFFSFDAKDSQDCISFSVLALMNEVDFNGISDAINRMLRRGMKMNLNQVIVYFTATN